MDDFSPRVGNCELDIKSGCERTEGNIGLVREVGIQVLDFIWESLLLCYSFSFVGKRDVKS